MKPIHFIVGLLLLLGIGAWFIKQKLYPTPALPNTVAFSGPAYQPDNTSRASQPSESIAPDKTQTQIKPLTRDDVEKLLDAQAQLIPMKTGADDATNPSPVNPPQDKSATPIFVPTPPTDLLDPHEMARSSLPFVGSDPVADVIWFNAINDPTISAKQRSDLIEDLNEDSFPDPKNITKDDLPLIMSRMELIEQVAADAMDESNAKAFAEAYKDLTALLVKLSQD